jgi:lycopene beta-cyclase
MARLGAADTPLAGSRNSFPRRSRALSIGYNSLRSADLDRLMRGRLRPDQYRLGCPIAEIGTNHLLLEGGERIEAMGLIDARGPARAPGLELAWQKFVGRSYRLERPHGCRRPTIMDAKVDQSSGYRFVYTLPFSETEFMVEDTYYSTTSDLDLSAIRKRLDAYLADHGWRPLEVTGEETGILPVLLAGDVAAFWPARNRKLPGWGCGAASSIPQPDIRSPMRCVMPRC